MRAKLIVVSLTVLIGTLWMAPALAKPTEAELVDAITKAKILSGEYQINIVAEQNQATLSTFLDKASNKADDDCKINAVLLAKKLMDIDADLVKVKVLFYDVDGDHYRQVLVKAGDVLALGGGQIDKDKLLSSLEITRGSRGANSAEASSQAKPSPTTPSTPSMSVAPTAAGTTPSTPLTAAASPTSTPSTATAISKPTTPSVPTFNSAGISFTYPRDWIAKRGASASVLAHFFSSTLSDKNYIDIDFFNDNRSVEGLADEKYRDWLYQPNYQVVYSGALKLGAKGSIPGISRLITYQIENYPEYRYYQRHVFFGKPGRIYCLRYHAEYKDMQKVNAAFEHMLVTLQAQGLGSTASSTKATPGVKKQK